MKDFLKETEREELKKRHRQEKDRRTADRIKAVLMSDKGGSFREIAAILLLDEETISKHVEEYRTQQIGRGSNLGQYRFLLIFEH
jgi:DNA-binding NarL/FixJ family response regulator